MTRSLQKIRAASLMCLAVLFALTVLAEAAQAGQTRAAASPIPGRVAKVREGDWIIIRTGDGLIKETATKISDIKPDGKPGDEAWFEPIYMVEYTMEKFDGETGRPIDKPMNVVRALDHESEENAEILRSMRGRPQRRNVTIDGKKATVVVIPQVDEDGVHIENWFTDQFGIDGRAGIVVKVPDSDETYHAMEVVSFGSARQPANIQKYLQKKQ